MSSKITASSASTVDDQIAQESKDVDLAATSAVNGAGRAWMLLAHGGLLLVGVVGGALLVWWALTFHQSNEQLWMVPVGLVLLGTPIFVWLSVFASAGVCVSLWPLLLRRGTAAAAPLVSDPER